MTSWVANLRPQSKDLSMFSRIYFSAAIIGLAGLASTVLSTPQAAAQVLNAPDRAAEDNIKRLEELDEEARIRKDGDAVVSDPLTRKDLPPAGGPTFVLKSVSFSPPSVFLKANELEAIVAKYRGREIDFSQLSELVRDINDLYETKGIVTAAAVLSPQELGDGTVQIQLVEGKLGDVSFTGNYQTNNKFILDRIRLARGGTVDVPTASKDILLFNESNRARLRILLQPGASFGQTDIVLDVTEPPRHSLQAFLDNNGVDSTGVYQGSFIYRHYGMFGRDDTLMMFANFSEGTKAGTVRYELPFGNKGARVALGATTSDVVVLSGPTEILDIDGRASSAVLSLTRPISVSERWTWFGDFSFFTGKSESWSTSVPIVDSNTTKVASGVSFARRGARGITRGKLQVVATQATNNFLDEERRPTFFTGSLSGHYAFKNNRSFRVEGAFQKTREDLLPGDLLFQIGGPTTVRGYPSDGIAGDSGYYTNLEFYKGQFLNSESVAVYAFTDVGQVFSTFPSQTTLWSAGLGATYDFQKWGRLDVSAAMPILDSLTNQDSVVVSATLSFKTH